MIVDEYLSFLFEQDPQKVTKAVMYNPQLYSILGGIKVDLATFNMFGNLTTSYQNRLRNCQRFQDLENEVCVSNIRIDFLRRQIEIMRRGDLQCDTQRDPLVCRQKIRDKIVKVNEQIKKLVRKLTEIRAEMIVRRNKEAEEKKKEVETRGMNVPRQVAVT